MGTGRSTAGTAGIEAAANSSSLPAAGLRSSQHCKSGLGREMMKQEACKTDARSLLRLGSSLQT